MREALAADAMIGKSESLIVFRVLHFGIEKLKIITEARIAQAAHRCHTRWRQINPANIAAPALESHQHPQLADPVCLD